MARPGAYIPPVTLYADQQQVENAFRKATKPWICIHCRQSFTLLESMGSLACEQHPGYIQEDGRWSCCGQRLYPMRWAPNADIQRMHVGNGCPPVVPKVRGCQKADHNTSNKPWNHKDASEIADLSALLPFMNKEFPFTLRKGFDTNGGVLRRCAVRKIHVPPHLGATVTYLDNDGTEKTYTVRYYKDADGKINYLDANEVNHQVDTPDELPTDMNRHPEGLEQYAQTKDKQSIVNWWS